MLEKVWHTLPPLYDGHSRVLILGTMPSPKSREAGFYYAHPQNRFWRVLPAVLGEPPPEGIAGRREMCLRRGVALWDVLRTCEIEGAADAAIRSPEPNDLPWLLAPAGRLSACPRPARQTRRGRWKGSSKNTWLSMTSCERNSCVFTQDTSRILRKQCVLRGIRDFFALFCPCCRATRGISRNSRVLCRPSPALRRPERMPF